MYQKFYDPMFTKIRRKLSALVEGRRAELADDGRIRILTEKICSSPWIHLKHGRFRQCGLWQLWQELFQDVGDWPYIPSGCQNCWKVVIRPRNVRELFLLEQVLRASDLPSKCGIDFRTWTGHPWGGFVYADSQTQGFQYMDEIAEAVMRNIGQECAETIHLKRGCTEFDALMPSDKWAVHDEQAKLERYLTDIFLPVHEVYSDAEWIRASKKARWVEHANSIGDMTYKDVIGDVDLSVNCVRYEEVTDGE